MNFNSFLARFCARTLLGVVSFQLVIGTQLAVAQTAPHPVQVQAQVSAQAQSAKSQAVQGQSAQAQATQAQATQAQAAQAQVAPTPANGNTAIGSSANGTPVVEIATPNSAGVSHNLFTSYNVGSGGLILNNSSVNAVSLLGGGTVANTNLAAGRSASLILNEVTAPNSGSLLAGYQEILGPSAELVIANPWGVTCNGCGFVNTPRVTLTTGTPTLAPSGALSGFTITGGQIAIGANGLDATRQSTLDLLARSIAVAGNVVVGSQANGISGDLQLIAGANQFDYASRTASAIAGVGATPQFAIDSSLLGGMYADRIHLIVTEQGAGVRLAGNLSALADDLVISANGQIQLRGATSAARDINISGTDVQVDLSDANTYVYGGRDLNINASGNLELDTGSIGAFRNVNFTSLADLNDLGGTGDLRFSGGSGVLTANVGGTLNLSGGYWTAPQLTFTGTSAQIGSAATIYGSGSSGDAVAITTPGGLSITGGKVYSNADANLSASQLQTDSNAVVAATGALNVTVASGAGGGIDNAGILQGNSVTLMANAAGGNGGTSSLVGNGGAGGAGGAGAVASTVTTSFHNESTGSIIATNALTIGVSGGTGSAGGSTLANDGTIAGGTVAISTTDTSNTNTIQATSGLSVSGATLENSGKNAVIIGSTDATGSANISSASITNSGTIWSAGDLSLTPTTLTQQRDPAATANPLIGAGRDLTVAYTGVAALGTGDLQAGRNLTITGTSVIDQGQTAAGGAAGDVRYAGGNLVVTAASGGNADIAGGRWFATGNFDVTGDSVMAGYYIDPVTTSVVYTPGVQLFGGQGGSGQVALTARTGQVGLLSDASVYSGGDLTINQPSAFTLNQTNTLQASGTLSVEAAGHIDNSGTIVGGTVALDSNSATALVFDNHPTGTVYGSQSVQIGTAANPADTILVESPSVTNGGVFGGALNFNTNFLVNDGLIQGVGPGSVINANYLGNNAGGQIQGYTNASGSGGLTINAATVNNSGLLYDSSNLTIDAQNIENTVTGGIASAGNLNITAGANGALAVFNEGQIWGNTLNLTFNSGLINGADPGVPANRSVPGSIFASGDATISIGNGATLQNYGTIEAQGNLQLLSTTNGSGSLINQMSMVPDSELQWVTENNSISATSGDLGAVTVGANGSTNKQHVTVGGTQYYYFEQIGGSTDAYFDGQQTFVQNQALTVPASSIPTPTIRSGGTLNINGFQSVLNNGTISAAGDINITAPGAASTVQNTSLYFDQRNQVITSTDQYTCRTAFGSINDPVSCGASPNNVTLNSTIPYQTLVNYTAPVQGAAAFTGKILAGGNLNVQAGTIVNAGTPGAFTVTLPGANVQTGAIMVAPAGSPSARGGVTTLNVNGAQIPLPTGNNGRFVQTQGSGTMPLIETNPLFGIDSAALGSDYLTKLLGLQPDMQIQRLGDSSYEDYLIEQQVEAQTGQSVLGQYGYQGAMDKALFDNAATEAKSLNLTYGQALTSAQVTSLTSDIVWLVEEVVNGQKVVVPVVYLSNATRSAVDVGSGAVLSGYNVNLQGGTIQNLGGDIIAANTANLTSSGNIENLSGNIQGWNVALNAGGDIINSTLVNRFGDAANGVDVASRTATIQAGNTAVLNAVHDITLSGGVVTAAQDAALIAGHNVNVESVALTTNQSLLNGASTTQTQTALGAGVTAGKDLLIQGGQDVNLTGANVSAGGQAAVVAQNGNVNVNTLALTNSQSISRSTTGLYSSAGSDGSTTSASAEVGVQTVTTTQSTSNTTNLGSSISGNQVLITTGKGDVNINGSNLAAGTGGLVIDSAHNVNITAAQNVNQASNSTVTQREGFSVEANADGAYAGTTQSRDVNTTTTTQSIAQTSSLASGGDIDIVAKGDVTNQGTQILAAGNVVLQAQDVINKAAQSTTTTTNTDQQFQTKEQLGLTTNGTGQSIANAAQGNGDQVNVANPEAQFRATYSYSNDTQSTSNSTAQVTQINAGGNVVVNATNHASDEGTQYVAGKDIVISAADYQNKAAANVTSTTDDMTSTSGQASVGVDTSASVNVNLAAQGSHTTSGNSQSTAVTGALNAGGAVVITAKTGDVTLEGTQIKGTQGVGISAARDININQANNTTATTSSEQSGSGNASVSVSLVGAGGAVGGGASTKLANSNDTTSNAVAASINSANGSLALNAGGNITSQGANIAAANDVALKAAGDINLLAATDKVDKTGSVQAGGASVNVGFGTGAAKGSGSLGVNANFEQGQTDYHESTEHGSTISAGGNFSLDAGGDGHLVGTQVNAGSASLKTGGDLTLESAQHTVTDNSYDITGNIGISASKGEGAGGASGVGSGAGHGTGGTQAGGHGGNAAGGNAQVGVSISKQNIDTNTNASINTAGGTTVDVGKDLSLKGANINAQGGVSGSVAGNLDIETRTDVVNVNQTNVTAYAGVGPVGGSGGGSGPQQGQEGISTGLNHAAQDGGYTSVNVNKQDDVTIGKASGISGGAGGINVRVGGNTTLTGATNNGSDFQTQGQTVINSVQTHQNDSSTNFQVTGTIATAAGSKDGSGGSYGATFHLPHGAGGTEEPTNTPNTPHNSLVPDDVAPTTGNRTVAHNPADVPVGEPANVGGHANPDQVPVVGPLPNGHPVNEVPPPNPIHLAAGNEAQPNAHPVGGGDGQPNIHDAYANLQQPNAHPIGGGDGQPNVDDAHANLQQPNAHPVGGGDALPNVHDVYANLPGADGQPGARNLPDASPYNVRVPAPEDGSPGGRPIGNEDNYQSQGAANQPGDNPLRGPNSPDGNLAVRDTNNARPDNNAVPAQGQPVGASAPAHASKVVLDTIETVPVASDLNRDAIKVLDQNELVTFQRNLAEIIAYTGRPGKGGMRDELLAKVADSLHGSRVENGFTEFPLRPQYVGEDVAGFANWHKRSANDEPGDRYVPGRPETEPVRYLSADELKAARTYVDAHGNLAFESGAVPDGKYIFVVNRRGELIVAKPVEGSIHHSSLSDGEPVRIAGELKIVGGRITTITNRSGHFRPSTEAFKQFLVDVQDRHLDLTDAKAPLVRFETDNRGRFTSIPVTDNLLLENDVKNGQPKGSVASLAPQLYVSARSGADDHTLSVDNQPHVTGVVPTAPAPAAVAQATVSPTVRHLIESVPEASRLSGEADTALPDHNELVAFKRNLAEIIAYTNLPGKGGLREPLLTTEAASLAGPHDRGDGVYEFPLRPQYVGENINGFTFWHKQDGSEPGALYGTSKATILGVQYLTPEEQAQQRVYVNAQHNLTFKGRPLTDGTWIYVVTEQGEIIADRQQVGAYHHSSLAGGKPVLSAGEFHVDNGVLTEINNQSGHFRTTTESFKQFLVALGQEHVDLSRTNAPAISYQARTNGGFNVIRGENLLKAPDVVNAQSKDFLSPLLLPVDHQEVHGNEPQQGGNYVTPPDDAPVPSDNNGNPPAPGDNYGNQPNANHHGDTAANDPVFFRVARAA